MNPEETGVPDNDDEDDVDMEKVYAAADEWWEREGKYQHGPLPIRVMRRMARFANRFAKPS